MKIKTIYAAFLCFILAFSLCLTSCDGGSGAGEESGETSSVPVSVAETSTAAESTAPETEPAPDFSHVVGLSFDSVSVNGSRVNEPDGKAGQWMDANMTDRRFDYSASPAETISFRGWIGFDCAVVRFGYRIGDASPVFDASFTQYFPADADAVRDASNGGAFAERFAISVPMGAVRGEVTVVALAYLADGTIRELAGETERVYVNYVGPAAE